MSRTLALAFTLVVSLAAHATPVSRVTPQEMLDASDLVILAEATELKLVDGYAVARLRRVATYKGQSPDEVVVRWRESVRGETRPRLAARYVAFLRKNGDAHEPAFGPRSLLELRPTLIAFNSLPADFNADLLRSAADGKHAFEDVVFVAAWPFTTIDFGPLAHDLMLRGTDWTTGNVKVRAVMLTELEGVIAAKRRSDVDAGPR